ncbi:MAG: hypothetical protein U0R19_12230 [Bryobacteraceae bacterium]
MAQKLTALQPIAGMNYIYNVSSHVGCRRKCPNNPDDVQLVQFFIREIVPRFYESQIIPELPRLTGQIDGITAFYIYDIQRMGGTSMEVDGIVSPARGLVYAGSHPWLISVLNFKYKSFFPDLYDKIPFHPELRPTLRASLAA